MDTQLINSCGDVRLIGNIMIDVTEILMCAHNSSPSKKITKVELKMIEKEKKLQLKLKICRN